MLYYGLFRTYIIKYQQYSTCMQPVVVNSISEQSNGCKEVLQNCTDPLRSEKRKTGKNVNVG